MSKGKFLQRVSEVMDEAVWAAGALDPEIMDDEREQRKKIKKVILEVLRYTPPMTINRLTLAIH